MAMNLILVGILSAFISMPTFAITNQSAEDCGTLLLDKKSNVLKQLLEVALKNQFVFIDEIKDIQSVQELLEFVKSRDSNANTYAVKTGLKEFLQFHKSDLQSQFNQTIHQVVRSHEDTQVQLEQAKSKTKYIFSPEVTYKENLLMGHSMQALKIFMSSSGEPMIFARARPMGGGTPGPNGPSSRHVSLRKKIDEHNINQGSMIPDPPLPYYLITKNGSQQLLDGRQDLLKDQYQIFEGGKTLVLRFNEDEAYKFDLTQEKPQDTLKLITKEEYTQLVSEEKSIQRAKRKHFSKFKEWVDFNIFSDYSVSQPDKLNDGYLAVSNGKMEVTLLDLSSKNTWIVRAGPGSRSWYENVLQFTGTKEFPVLHVLNKSGIYSEISLHKELSE